MPTPIPGGGTPTSGRPRRIASEILEASLPSPGLDRLQTAEVLVVTTGQQPCLFTGPLYTIYKALSAIALARRLERERGGVPVVPIFWVAGDDHDFAEANHSWLLDSGGTPVRVTLRERPADAPLASMADERCGPEVSAALEELRARTPDTEFKDSALAWLTDAYRPEATLADAFAHALNVLLGGRGLVVLRAWRTSVKRLMAPILLQALGTTLDDGYLPVLLKAAAGRDRLRAADGAFVTRRSGERFTKSDLERIVQESPERLSPNVLLRPVVEAALLPSVAYAGGPGELEYFPQAAPLYPLVGDGVDPQPVVPRWSGMLVESRVEKVLQKQGIEPGDLAGPAGALEARLVRDALPPELAGRLAEVRVRLEDDYAALAREVARIDPTLERSVQSARNASLNAVGEIERKIVAALKRTNETLLGQLSRARAALFPNGKPQERVLGLPSFLIRYGPVLVDTLEAEVARRAGAS